MKIPEPDPLALIRDLHKPGDLGHGITSGYCSECDYVWPCPTYHLAAGWGSWEGCWEDHWCEHAGVAM